MTDILQEIQEASNEKKMEKILSRSALSVFIFGTIFVLYLSIHSWYDNKKIEKIQEDGVLLTQLANKINFNNKNTVNTNKQNQIAKLENLATEESSAYSALASIYLASLSLLNGNDSKAIYYYQRIAKSNNFAPILKEHAYLTEINTKLQFNDDLYESSIKQVQDYFQPYVQKDNSINTQALLNNKSFAIGMAITGIGIENRTKNFQFSREYIKVLKSTVLENENANFIIDMMEQYILSIIPNSTTK